MVAYIVRYWETRGIYPLKGTVMPNGRFRAEYPAGLWGTFAPSEYALSTNEAVEMAKALREKKLQALQREAERLINTEIKVNL